MNTHLNEAAVTVSHQRDYRAEHGEFDREAPRPADDQGFDDWASDLLDNARLADAKALDEAYASAGEAEGYDRDLTNLVQTLQALIALDAKFIFRDQAAYDAWWATKRALEQFEPWLDQEDNDPRQMGWVDDKGRP